MDARNENLTALKQLVEEVHVKALREASVEPENAYIQESFCSALTEYVEQLRDATTFDAVGSTLIDIHYLCYFYNLWLPKREEGMWRMLCLLARLSKNGTLELACWDNYPFNQT